MRVAGKLCETGEVVTVTLAAGRIAGFESGADRADLGAADVWLAPGFLDLQLNVYAGCDFNIGAWGDREEVSGDLQPIFEQAARAGTALLCSTITTNSRGAMVAALRRLAAALDADP